MGRKNRIWFFALIFGVCMMIGTSCESEYSQLVKSEMKTGKIYENYLFDLNVGDTKKDFYAKCWELNANKKISQGSGNKYAKFVQQPEVGEDSLAAVNVYFFGIFDENEVMQGIEMKMDFYSWAPWNDRFTSDKLLEHTKNRFMKQWGGNDFIEIDIKGNDKKAYVKVDGNRQIRMYALDEKEIMVKIEDLRTKLEDK